MDDTKELILRAHNGDKAARDKLVLENIGLVYSVSRRFAGRGYELEDINQIGTIGLIKAIDKFDDSFDVRFSTYAVPMIAGEIKRFLRDDGMLKVSRSLKENGYRIKKASDKLVSQNGREATIEELAAATELSLWRLRRIRMLSRFTGRYIRMTAMRYILWTSCPAAAGIP